MGGNPPLGYDVKDRKLIVNEEDAAQVRWIFSHFLEISSATELAREIDLRGIRTRRGNRIDQKAIYRILNNRAYLGEAVHKGTSYLGEHDAFIDMATWDTPEQSVGDRRCRRAVVHEQRRQRHFRLAVAQDKQACGGHAFGQHVTAQGGGGQRRKLRVQRGEDGLAGGWA